MGEENQKSWVWHSTEASRSAGQISILAIVETVLCVIAYWVLMLWLGVTFHHWLILIATPLVLLRSEQSIAKGVEWFSAYLDDRTEIKLHSFKGVSLIFLSFSLSGIAAWLLAINWLVGTEGWALFGKAAVVGLLVTNFVVGAAVAVAGITTIAQAGASAVVVAVSGAGASAVAIAVAGAGAGAVSGAGAGAGVGAVAVVIFALLFRALITRIYATTRFLLQGTQNFPYNWRFSTIVSDFFHPPELVPGHAQTTFSKRYILIIWDNNDTKSFLLKIFDSIFGLLLLIIFFIPALLWRWSIKSTAWFYFPLLWLRRGWQNLDGDALQIWAKSYSSKVINWVWLGSGFIAIAVLSIALFSFQKWDAIKQATEASGAPMTIVGFLFSLNYVELINQPWNWFYIPSYALTIWIFFALDGIAKEIRHGGAMPQPYLPAIKRLEWAANARAVLTNLALVIALWYFLDAVNAKEMVATFIKSII